MRSRRRGGEADASVGALPDDGENGIRGSHSPSNDQANRLQRGCYSLSSRSRLTTRSASSMARSNSPKQGVSSTGQARSNVGPKRRNSSRVTRATAKMRLSATPHSIDLTQVRPTLITYCCCFDFVAVRVCSAALLFWRNAKPRDQQRILGVEGDAAYFARRAKEERDAALTAAHPAARAAHVVLANRYEEFALAIDAHEEGYLAAQSQKIGR